MTWSKLPQTVRLFALLLAGAVTMPGGIEAQGLTTGAIVGTVHTDEGVPLDEGTVLVVHTTSGHTLRAPVRRGRFAATGLAIGGPYVVHVRRPGYLPGRSSLLLITLGEPVTTQLVLHRAATRLGAVEIRPFDPGTAGPRVGTPTLIEAPLLRRLPSMNRDLYDFVRLVPELWMKIALPNAGFSDGGAGFRANNFLVDGAPERILAGSGSVAFAGGRSLPLDAVREYEVLLAPFDVRYGNFIGALVNSVTEAGTNAFRGSLFGNARSERLARSMSGSLPHERVQAGISAGGPIVQDRLHYFIAGEVQRHAAPAPGPFLGQHSDVVPPPPGRMENVQRISAILEPQGLRPGSGARVRNRHPLTNGFARLDLALPEVNGRAMLWHSAGASDIHTFSRIARDTFSLSSVQYSLATRAHLTPFQLHTPVPWLSGARNEFMVAVRTDGGDARTPLPQLLVRVTVPRANGGLATVNTGTHEAAHGVTNRLRTTLARNTVSLAAGSHLLTIGAEAEGFRIIRRGVPCAYGTWGFASLDSLALGLAERYELRREPEGGSAALEGTQGALFIGDHWNVGRGAVVVIGVRADLLEIEGRAPYNRDIDSLFQRR